jgi:hypothetical protein
LYFLAFCIFILSTNHSNGLIVLARPDPYQQPEHVATEKPNDYSFVKKVTEPCGVASKYFESVTREEVINIVHMVQVEGNAAKSKMVCCLST